MGIKALYFKKVIVCHLTILYFSSESLFISDKGREEEKHHEKTILLYQKEFKI